MITLSLLVPMLSSQVASPATSAPKRVSTRPSIGTIGSVRGRVLVRSPRLPGYRPLNVGAMVRVGDQVQIPKNGVLVVRHRDGAVERLATGPWRLLVRHQTAAERATARNLTTMLARAPKPKPDRNFAFPTSAVLPASGFRVRLNEPYSGLATLFVEDERGAPIYQTRATFERGVWNSPEARQALGALATAEPRRLTLVVTHSKRASRLPFSLAPAPSDLKLAKALAALPANDDPATVRTARAETIARHGFPDLAREELRKPEPPTPSGAK